MRILLLVSAFNGLSQRAWCALGEAGHDVGLHITKNSEDITAGVRAAQPDLILCPFLVDRVPEQVWSNWRTVVLRPGPLDRAIVDGAGSWGVSAVQAGGDQVWAGRTFAMPAAPPRKGSLYNGPVSDAAMECLFETVEKATDPEFTAPPGTDSPDARPAVTQADRAFGWAEPTGHILRRIRAADGSPGVRTEVGGLEVFAYDAHPGLAFRAQPGALLGRRQGAVLVGTGDGAIWLGHLRDAAGPAIKLPATTLLGARLRGVPNSPLGPGIEPETPSYRQIRYRRGGAVGWLAFDFYNGAMSAGHCRRLLAAFRHAAAQDTRVLVLRGGADSFSNGLHLNVIEQAADPAATAWANIKAFTAIAREIITCSRQVVISAYAGSASAGGALLGLGADVVAARAGIVLNPYNDRGLHSAELHTYTLPRRVGAEAARRLVDDRLPVSATRAQSLGLVDEVGPRHPDAYTDWLTELAERHSDARSARAKRAAKAKRLAAEPVPLDAYEARELAELSQDVFADRSGFAERRRAFVTKAPVDTPAALLATSAPRPVHA